MYVLDGNYVLHRTDGLEINVSLNRNSVVVLHRTDGLEICGMTRRFWLKVLHRTDGLENDDV